MINEQVPDYQFFKNTTKYRRNEKNIKKVIRMTENYLEKFQIKVNAKESYRPYYIKRRYKEINKYHHYRKLNSDILYNFYSPLSKIYFPCRCCKYSDHNLTLKQTNFKQRIENNRIKIVDFYSLLNEENEEIKTFEKSFNYKYEIENSSDNQDSNFNQISCKQPNFKLKIIRNKKQIEKLKKFEDQYLKDYSIENIAKNYDYVFVDENETNESEFEFINIR